MADLWSYQKEAILRVVKEIQPDTKAVHLFSGLYAAVEKWDGEWESIPEYCITRRLTLKDLR